MPIFSTVFSGLKGFLGLLIPPIKKKYFDQPKVHLELKSIGVGKIPLGLSRKNRTDTIINEFDAIRHFRIEWNYALTFYNNSEYSAYNLKLIEPVGNSTLIAIQPSINPLAPLIPNSNTQYSATFFQNFEVKAQDSVKLMNDLPNVLKRPMTLEYTNVKGTKFYTTFNFHDGIKAENIFSRKISH